VPNSAVPENTVPNSVVQNSAVQNSAAADEDIESVLAEIKAAVAQITGETSAVRAQLIAEKEANRDKDDELAAARRRGEEGRDWQIVQQRIDLGRTTLSDVMSGVDLSDEARAVRVQLQKLLPGAREKFAAIVEQGEENGQFADLKAAQRDLARAAQRLRATNLNF